MLVMLESLLAPLRTLDVPLPNVLPHIIAPGVGLGFRSCLVLRATNAFEVAGFVVPETHTN